MSEDLLKPAPPPPRGIENRLHKTPAGWFEVWRDRHTEELTIMNTQGEDLAIIHVRSKDGAPELERAKVMADALDTRFQS
jgi:hypothetical protein